MKLMRKARRLSKKLIRRPDNRLTGISVVFLLIWTLILGAAAAMSVLKPDFPFLLPVTAYVLTVVSLLINLPLSAAARQKEHPFSAVTFPRFALTLPLALPAFFIAWGIIALFNYINIGWTGLMAWGLQDMLHIVLSGVIVLAVLLLFALVCSLLGLFARQVMLAAAENDRPLPVGRAFGNALAHMFAPIGLALTRLGWFLLIAVLFAAAVCGVCCLTAKITFSLGFQMLGFQLAAALLDLPLWGWLAAFAVACLWIVGLGLVFWPRWHAVRVYYARLLLKSSEE